LVRAGEESVEGDGQIARDSAHAPIMPPLGGALTRPMAQACRPV
jgi:hypothetical protein